MRLWLLTAAPARSAVTDCPGSVIAFERKATLVSFCARGSAFPTWFRDSRRLRHSIGYVK